jgi:hypothetical protein
MLTRMVLSAKMIPVEISFLKRESSDGRDQEGSWVSWLWGF